MTTFDNFKPDHVNIRAIVNGKKKDITDLDVLKGWLGTAQVFYVFGHGAGSQGLPSPSRIPRSTELGNYYINQGEHLDLLPAVVNFDLTDDDLIVPTYVGGKNYVLAWIDSCNSAGGDSVMGQIGTLDTTWATAFNATTFIGCNGYGIVNSLTEYSGWYKWRTMFWGKMAIGETVAQAYSNCWAIPGAVNTSQYTDSYTLPPSTTQIPCTPGDGYGGNPRVVLYGDPYDTTLVPQ